MKFKDLFKAKDNTGYEVRQSTGINTYNPCYRIPETELLIVEYMPKPRYVEVFINKPWYQRTQRYLIGFR